MLMPNVYAYHSYGMEEVVPHTMAPFVNFVLLLEDLKGIIYMYSTIYSAGFPQQHKHPII